MQLIKGGFSREFGKQTGSRMEIWQVGFHDWTIRDAGDYQAKVRYIHMNPVEETLVERPNEWMFGSASGKYELDPALEKFKG